jgi:hypothetical protein
MGSSGEGLSNNVQQQQQESERLDAVARVAVLPAKMAAETEGLGSASILKPLVVDEAVGQFNSLQVAAQSPKTQRVTVDAVPPAAVIDAVAAEAFVSPVPVESVAGSAVTAAAAAAVVVGPVHAAAERHQAGSGFGRILVRRKFLKNPQPATDAVAHFKRWVGQVYMLCRVSNFSLYELSNQKWYSNCGFPAVNTLRHAGALCCLAMSIYDHMWSWWTCLHVPYIPPAPQSCSAVCSQ